MRSILAILGLALASSIAVAESAVQQVFNQSICDDDANSSVAPEGTFVIYTRHCRRWEHASRCSGAWVDGDPANHPIFTRSMDGALQRRGSLSWRAFADEYRLVLETSQPSISNYWRGFIQYTGLSGETTLDVLNGTPVWTKSQETVVRLHGPYSDRCLWMKDATSLRETDASGNSITIEVEMVLLGTIPTKSVF